MKTTIEISDPLLEMAKSVAAQEGTTLKALVEQGLRTMVEEQENAVEFTLRDASVSGNGLQPHVKQMDWDGITDLSYGGL